MISHKYKFIFVHIPKTGGMSIANLIGREALPVNLLTGDDYWTDIHGKYFHYVGRYGQDTWDKYYKFAFVRNPWDRLVSCFSYLTGGGNNRFDKKLSDRYIKKYEGDFTRFVKEFVAADRIKYLFHMHPQHEFICDRAGRVLVDFVGKLENIREDFNKICDHFGVPRYTLPHINQTQRKLNHFTDYYNDETREIVADKYSRDIELFGYKFEKKKGGGDRKIFGVGLNKTGTTTLGKCFEVLGYRHISVDASAFMNYNAKNFRMVFDTVDKYDSFEDWPWPLMYRELDEKYPDAKFILTIRESPGKWFESICKHSLRITNLPFRKLIYGYDMPHEHKDHYIDFYNTHNKNIRDYFADKPGKLIVLCWEHGHGWKELCAFLDKDVPNLPFPHENKSPD